MNEYRNIQKEVDGLCENREIPMPPFLMQKVKKVYEKGLSLEIDSQETPLMLASDWAFDDLVWGFIQCAKQTNTNLHTGGTLDLQEFLGYRNSSGQTALHVAAMKDAYNVIRVLLREVSAEHLISYRDESGNTPISLLERNGDTFHQQIFEVMEAAASKGDHQVDPTTTDDKQQGIGLVPVYTEIEMDPKSLPTSHINETRESLNKLDDGVLELTENKSTILHLVSELGDTDYAKDILKRHPSLIHNRNIEGETPFYVAAREGHIDILEILISYANPDKIEELATRSTDKDTALHIAIQEHHVGVVFWLVKRIPRLANHVNDLNKSPLYLAADKFFGAIVELIVKECKEKAYDGPDGKTALHAAVLSDSGGHHYRRERCIRSLLLANIGLLKIQDKYGWTPLHYAAKLDRSYTIRELLEKRTDYIGNQMTTTEADDIITSAFHIPDKKGRNMLHVAIEYEQTDIIRLICEDESLTSLINQKDSNGVTPLHLFMAFHLKMNGIMMDGWTPLHYAAKFGRSDIIRNLLENRTDDYIGNQMTTTEADDIITSAFHFADNNGRNVLHVAIEYKQLDIIKLIFKDESLIRLINQKDSNDNTPLHLLMASDLEMKGIVIDARFNIHDPNNKYRTPLDMASSEEKREILEKGMLILVREHGKRGRRRWEDLEMEIKEKEKREKEKEKREKEKEKKKQVFTRIGDNVVLVVTLIATATFAAAFAVPGGFDGNEGPDQGMPILLRKAAYKVFVMANALAFSCSCTVLFGYIRLQLDDAGEKEKDGSMNIISLQYLLTGISMVAMAVAFVTGSYVILTPSLGLAISACTMCLCIMVPLSIIPRKRLGFATAILRKLA